MFLLHITNGSKRKQQKCASSNPIARCKNKISSGKKRLQHLSSVTASLYKSTHKSECQKKLREFMKLQIFYK